MLAKLIHIHQWMDVNEWGPPCLSRGQYYSGSSIFLYPLPPHESSTNRPISFSANRRTSCGANSSTDHRLWRTLRRSQTVHIAAIVSRANVS